MNKKRIIILSSYQSKYGGNFIPSLLSLEQFLNGENVQCIFIFPRKAAEREWYKWINVNREIYTMDFTLRKVAFIRELRKLVKRINASVIYAHFGKFIEVELTCLITSRLRGIIHIHSDFSMGKTNFRERLYRYIVYKLLPVKVSFISVSPAFVKYNSSKIHFIPNALARDRISCPHIGGETVRKRFSLSETDILCEIFGWSPDVKGVDIAVEAIGRAIEEYTVKLKLAIIVGEAVNKNKMQEYIRSHTHYNGDEDFLCFLDPSEDVFSYHEAADILLMPSRSEGFPYAALEMISLGKRCVASDLPGTKWMHEFKTAFLCKPNNIIDCSEKIIEAVKNGRTIDIEAGEKVLKMYSIDEWTERIANIVLENIC